MKKQLFVQYALTIMILFVIAFFWEFLVENSVTGHESASEHWQYIITVVISAMLALTIPTIISLREWRKRQRVQDELQKIQGELISAIEQTSSIIHFKILNRNFDSMMGNPYLGKCWEEMQCREKACSCYGKEPQRCWQVVGTFCTGKSEGAFVEKYDNCYQCRVYKDATCTPSLALKEHLNNMIHVLEFQRGELIEAFEDIKILRGIIPICMYCKKIRDDQGAWDIVEAYISKHSEAKFSHGICPQCYEKEILEKEQN